MYEEPYVRPAEPPIWYPDPCELPVRTDNGYRCQIVEDAKFAYLVKDWDKKVFELVLQHIPPVFEKGEGQEKECTRLVTSYACPTEFFIDIIELGDKRMSIAYLPWPAMNAVLDHDYLWLRQSAKYLDSTRNLCRNYYGPHPFRYIVPGPAVRTDEGVPWYYVLPPRALQSNRFSCDTPRRPLRLPLTSQRLPFILPMPADALGSLEHEELNRTTLGDLFLKIVVPYGGDTLVLTRGQIQGYHSHNLRSLKKRKLLA